jgi:hypothetical protein
VRKFAEKGMFLRRVIGNLSLMIAVIVLVAGFFEGTGAFYAHFIADMPNLDAKQFRLAKPPPYARSPFFSNDFVTESFVEPRGWSMAKGADFVIPNDFAGHWFNVRDGRRITIGTPPRPHHYVHVFGASSVYCAEVPDEYTITSLLQKRLNAASPGVWEVRNYGVPSVNTRQELLRLQSINVESGDVVIFYDGPTDLERVYNGNERGWIIDEKRKILDAYTPAERFILYLNRRFARYSNFIREFVALKPKPSADMADPTLVATRLQLTKDTYRNNIRAAANYAAAHGARFVHFLQPTLFSRSSMTAYEQRLKKMAVRSYPGLDELYRLGYPALREVVEENRRANVDTYDATGLFDERPPDEEVYLDFSHLAEVGNAKVATLLFDTTFADLSSPPNASVAKP